MLEDLGYIVLSAESAKKALEISETHGHGIRLVITDVIMPEMKGRELAVLWSDPVHDRNDGLCAGQRCRAQVI